MKKRTRIVVALLLIGSVSLAFIPGLKRTTPGRIWRFILGSPGATQDVEDLVDDVRSLPEPERLRKWSQALMDSYASGILTTKVAPESWSIRAVLAPKEQIPSWLPGAFREPGMFGYEPEVVICLNQDGSPRYLQYKWYLKGLIIFGDDEADIHLIRPFCMQEAVPGVHAYSLEK